ncbi:hypothetical protein Acr_00g0085230 [Actinidia rufa]|uniref:Uncharacterized protein n=1 Tax=Actinidia rufa TaxID=165716 RepID=A0A7J0DVP4_9ERIC|nr:hypothetical protein Acr_00g0085230 [Actinidia rufa]
MGMGDGGGSRLCAMQSGAFSGLIWDRVLRRFQINRRPSGWSFEKDWAVQKLARRYEAEVVLHGLAGCGCGGLMRNDRAEWVKGYCCWV